MGVGQSRQGELLSTEQARQQPFRAEEYNPLRNPNHFSDARHLETKGVYLETRSRLPMDDVRREQRVDVNSRGYKDTLEQIVEDRERSEVVRQSMPAMVGRRG